MSNPEVNKLALAEPIIQRHVIFAMSAGFIPLPIFDIIAVTAVQLDMIKQLCKVYGQDYSETSGKAFVGTLTGTTLARIAARGVGSIFKVIPVIGSALGGATVAAFSGATTYAIGQVVARHFDSGGSILDFDSSDLKDFYEEQVEKGKEMVEEWQTTIDETLEDVKTSTEDIFENELEAKLTKLEALKEAGLVTETEYKRIKARIMKNQ